MSWGSWQTQTSTLYLVVADLLTVFLPPNLSLLFSRSLALSLSLPRSLFPSQDQTDPMSGMSLLAGKALSSARMSDILSQTSLSGSQQLHQREGSGQ